MGDVPSPLWLRTADVDHMRRDGRDEDPGHAWTAERLGALYPGTSCTLLDCGVMSGVTYAGLRDAGLPVDYTGIDVSPRVLDACRTEHPGARWLEMSVTDLAFGEGSFDVVNSRHLLECLPYYETAVREMFRVARTHVIIGFFQVPRAPEALLRRETDEGYIWLNRYDPGPFEELLHRFSREVETADLRHGPRRSRIYLCTKR
ncbi:class I SAM-dependent methyltransferase [Nocardiopsis sp. NPDC055824]